MGRAGELAWRRLELLLGRAWRMIEEFCLRLALISFILRTNLEEAFLLGKLIEVCETFYPP